MDDRLQLFRFRRLFTERDLYRPVPWSCQSRDQLERDLDRRGHRNCLVSLESLPFERLVLGVEGLIPYGLSRSCLLTLGRRWRPSRRYTFEERLIRENVRCASVSEPCASC